jgi:energy-coupling factor transporter transmembrane protein EcfT
VTDHLTDDNTGAWPVGERHRRGHPGAWIAWATAGAGIALLSRNPWQLLLVLLGAVGARWRLSGHPPGRADAALFGGLLAFPTVLNFLLSRTGSTVLWRLPLPWIGGNFTLEALLFGAVAGIQIATLLAVMLTFGAAVSSTDLLRRVPSGLYPVGLTASIGLTFAPQARRTFHQIREAQEVRGYQARGWRDLPQLIVPMVVMSLENAIALGESLATRGWGQSRLGPVGRWGMLGAWLLLAAGLVLWLVAPELAWLSILALVAGLAAFVGLRRTMMQPTRFRPDRWSSRATWVTGLCLGSLTVYAVVTLVQPGLLIYYPYPHAVWPQIHLPLLAACLPLGLPTLVFHHA